MFTLDIFKETVEDLPDDGSLRRAVGQALESAAQPGAEPCELALRIVDAAEMQTLNGRYRGREYATNVLSFPADLPDEVSLNLLGDLVICAPVVRDEASVQGKPLAAHWDHMLVHGTLHLLGYDHETDREAEHMESLETRILAALGWPCPYEGRHQSTPLAAAQQQAGVTAR